MLEAIIGGERDARDTCRFGTGLLRRKLDALRLALDGKVTEHHRFCLKQLLAQYDFVNGQIDELDQEIARRTRDMDEAVRLLDTIPGIDEIAARALLAEIGTKMEQFPTAQHCASWAGLCPGNKESAGKRAQRQNAKRQSVAPAGAGASSLGSFPCERYIPSITVLSHWQRRRGKKRALVAVAHTILVIAWHVLKSQSTYQELGGDFFEKRQTEALQRSLVRRLERMGHRVTLTQQTATA